MASLPPIQSAILLDGMGDGGRIKLDVPRQYADALLLLQRMAGQSFKVIIETVPKAEKAIIEDAREDTREVADDILSGLTPFIPISVK